MKAVLTPLISAVIGGLVAVLLVAAGVLGLDRGAGNVTIAEAAPPPLPAEGKNTSQAFSVRDIYGKDGPGVVSVSVASKDKAGSGSGFVLDKTGYIVTNQHVVSGADKVSVQFGSGTRADARVVGEDRSTDVAVLKVEAPEGILKPLTLGNSDVVQVGDPVVSIGNPLNVGISVTTGIVSGLGRSITAPNNFTIDGAIQTDAAINPGNSGGPLLDARGLVIGVNSQIASETGGFQGVGFAVPINTVKNVVKQLITSGRVEHGYLGVQMFPVGVEELAAYTGYSIRDLAREYKLPENGAIVSDTVPGGPAAQAGLKGGAKVDIKGIPVTIGDVITEVKGKRVSNANDVIKVVNSLKPKDKLELTVVTPGEKPRRVEVTLGTQPADAGRNQ